VVTDGQACVMTSAPAADGSVVVTLAGELDAGSVGPVREELFGLVAPGRTLVIDLAGLEFLDSSGLGALVLTLTRARAAGGVVTIVHPSARVRRVLEASHLVELFGVADADEAPADAAVGSTLRAVRDAGDLEELRSLLVGFENLLRWGDLRPEQVTLALGGEDVADETTDLALAARVRRPLALLGAAAPPPSAD
jgi:anti-anti-sigma factor